MIETLDCCTRSRFCPFFPLLPSFALFCPVLPPMGCGGGCGAVPGAAAAGSAPERSSALGQLHTDLLCLSHWHQQCQRCAQRAPLQLKPDGQGQPMRAVESLMGQWEE